MFMSCSQHADAGDVMDGMAAGASDTRLHILPICCSRTVCFRRLAEVTETSFGVHFRNKQQKLLLCVINDTNTEAKETRRTAGRSGERQIKNR